MLNTRGGPEDSVSFATTTDANGDAVLDDPRPEVDGLIPGSYDLTHSAGPDWSLRTANRSVTRTNDDGTTSTSSSVLTPNGATVTTQVEQKTSQVLTLGDYNPKGWVVAEAFNDTKNDGVRQDRESKLVDFPAELLDVNGSFLQRTTTGNDGRAVFYVDRKSVV